VVRIAVIGAGPKAAAIAARASIERELPGGLSFEVTIFEREEVCAHWRGTGGYTDGEQPLCTPSERDVGFPYQEQGRASQLLHAQFSWGAFQIASNYGYSSWIDRGGLPASHSSFADYIKWVINASEALVVEGEVTALRQVRRKWEVAVGPVAHRPLFDGVVITGPGPPRHVKRTGKPTVFDGMDFWLRTDEVRRLLKRKDAIENLVVVGGGGTAAAILSWIRRNRLDFEERATIVVCDQATLLSRGDSVFENQLFSDADRWGGLTRKTQDSFFDRINRGVVWSKVMTDINDYRSLQFIDGRASCVGGTPRRATVGVDRDDAFTEIVAEAVIDASGFDAWWFARLLPTDVIPLARADRKAWEDSVGQHLQLDMPAFPPLHVPALSKRLGPGLGSLMSLGAMAERVLNRYR
jgi:mycobactin lysine-N-oxygenase